MSGTRKSGGMQEARTTERDVRSGRVGEGGRGCVLASGSRAEEAGSDEVRGGGGGMQPKRSGRPWHLASSMEVLLTKPTTDQWHCS